MWTKLKIQSYKFVFVTLIFCFFWSTNVALNQKAVSDLSRMNLTKTSDLNAFNNYQSQFHFKQKTEKSVGNKEKNINNDSVVQAKRRSVDVVLVNKVYGRQEISPQ